MPANYVWAPPTALPPLPGMPPPPPSFTTLTNWRVGYGPTDFATELPNADDHLYFDGGVSTADCVIPVQNVMSGQNTFAGIHLVFGLVAVPGPLGSPPPPPTNTAYSGTVTLSNSFPVGTLEVDCGAIAQGSDEVTSGNGTTLTITSSLHWTGGTLNSNSTAGTIALAPGASGVAEPSFTNPGIDGTVELGSTLILNASTLQLNTGTYNLTLGEGLIATNGSVLSLEPVPAALQSVDAVLTIDSCAEFQGGNAITVEEGSEATISSLRRPRGNNNPAGIEFKGKAPRLTNHGTVEINDLSELIFLPAPNRGGGYIQSNSDSEDPVAPVTKIEAGCAITCNLNTSVDISAGKFLVTERSVNGTPLADQPAISVTSEANVGFNLGRDATFGRSGGVTAPIEMQITGAMRADGTFELYLDDTSAAHDKFVVSQQITFDEHAAVKAFWLPEANPNDPWTVGSWWKMFRSDSEGDDPISGMPSFTRPAVGSFLDLERTVGNEGIILKRTA